MHPKSFALLMTTDTAARSFGQGNWLVDGASTVGWALNAREIKRLDVLSLANHGATALLV
jgi:hypothetical protein